jgi:hypothetical protein
MVFRVGPMVLAPSSSKEQIARRACTRCAAAVNLLADRRGSRPQVACLVRVAVGLQLDLTEWKGSLRSPRAWILTTSPFTAAGVFEESWR